MEDKLEMKKIAAEFSPDINVDDPRWTEELSEISRKNNNINSVPKAKHSYLATENKVSKYSRMFFGKDSLSVNPARASVNDFMVGLKDHVIEAYESPAKWSAASIESLSEKITHIGKEYKVVSQEHFAIAREALKAPVNDAMAVEAGMDLEMNIEKLEVKIGSELRNSGAFLSKFSKFAKGGIVGVDIIDKVNDHTKSTFVKSAEFVGEGIGFAAGDFLVDMAAIPTAGGALIATPVVTVGTSAFGGYVFERGAKWVEDKTNSFMRFLENRKK